MALEKLIFEQPLLLLASIAVILASVVFIRVISKRRRFSQLSTQVPGPKGLPVIGNTLQCVGSTDFILERFYQWTKEFGPRVAITIPDGCLILAGAKDLEKLLSSTSEANKSQDYDKLVPWLGDGLLISSGSKWVHRRKLLTPAFHFKVLDQFVDVFNEQSLKCIQNLRDNFCDGQEFDIFPFITKCTLDIICETAMGAKIDDEPEFGEVYIEALSRMKEIQVYRNIRPWLDSEFVWNYFTPYGKEEKDLIKKLHGFTHKVIDNRKQKFLEAKRNGESGTSEDPKKRLALLDLMFEAQEKGEAIDDVGIREETEVFMFGGHDTTSTVASFTLFHIGNHPNIQEKVVQELRGVFGNSNRPVTSEDLPKLKYLECCIKESMRLTSPVPLITRQIKHDFKLDDTIVIPPGTFILISMFALHRDPDVFPNPLEFQPERFLPENSEGRHPFAFLPFSAGPRNCIGQKFALMEEKVLLANFLRHLTVTSCEKLEDLVLCSELVLHSKNGMKMKIKPRTDLETTS